MNNGNDKWRSKWRSDIEHYAQMCNEEIVHFLRREKRIVFFYSERLNLAIKHMQKKRQEYSSYEVGIHQFNQNHVHNSSGNSTIRKSFAKNRYCYQVDTLKSVKVQMKPIETVVYILALYGQCNGSTISPV